jgi:hypothetical protein
MIFSRTPKQQQTIKRKYMKNPKLLAIACNLALLTTGAIAQPTVLDTVGPDTNILQASDYVGTLVVFTATEARADGKDAYYYPHTSYEVFRNGQPFRHVDNGRTLEVETPSRVILPKGHYEVMAQSETEGAVKVPVKIETGRTTVVNLEQGPTK